MAFRNMSFRSIALLVKNRNNSVFFQYVTLELVRVSRAHQASVMSKFSLSQRRPQRSRHTTYLCNLSIFSIPLFKRTSTSSLESILTDSTNARIWYSSHFVMAVPACSRISAANYMWLVNSASSACRCSSSARLVFSSACWARIVLNRSL